jgi:hypothetical protein
VADKRQSDSSIHLVTPGCASQDILQSPPATTTTVANATEYACAGKAKRAGSQIRVSSRISRLFKSKSPPQPPMITVDNPSLSCSAGRRVRESCRSYGTQTVVCDQGRPLRRLLESRVAQVRRVIAAAILSDTRNAGRGNDTTFLPIFKSDRRGHRRDGSAIQRNRRRRNSDGGT